MTEFRAIHREIDKLWAEYDNDENTAMYEHYLLGKIRGLQLALQLLAKQEKHNGPRT